MLNESTLDAVLVKGLIVTTMGSSLITLLRFLVRQDPANPTIAIATVIMLVSSVILGAYSMHF
jgi:hypothetical protein